MIGCLVQHLLECSILCPFLVLVRVNAQHDFPQAQEYLTRYQDPRQADTIMKVQQELDETKIVLVSLTPLKGTRKSNLSDKLSSLYACSTKRSSRSYKEERTWIS